MDVDGAQFSYNASKHQISFDDTLWLSEGLFYHMKLYGLYEILELSDTKLVFQQATIAGTTIFSYHRYK